MIPLALLPSGNVSRHGSPSHPSRQKLVFSVRHRVIDLVNDEPNDEEAA